MFLVEVDQNGSFNSVPVSPKSEEFSVMNAPIIRKIFVAATNYLDRNAMRVSDAT